MDVRGADVPRMVTAELGLSIHWLNWLKREPPMIVPKKTVITYAEEEIRSFVTQKLGKAGREHKMADENALTFLSAGTLLSQRN